MSSVIMNSCLSYLSIECLCPAVLIHTVPHFKARCPSVDKGVHFPLRCNSCHFFPSSKINLSNAAVSKTQFTPLWFVLIIVVRVLSNAVIVFTNNFDNCYNFMYYNNFCGDTVCLIKVVINCLCNFRLKWKIHSHNFWFKLRFSIYHTSE